MKLEHIKSIVNLVECANAGWTFPRIFCRIEVDGAFSKVKISSNSVDVLSLVSAIDSLFVDSIVTPARDSHRYSFTIV